MARKPPRLSPSPAGQRSWLYRSRSSGLCHASSSRARSFVMLVYLASDDQFVLSIVFTAQALRARRSASGSPTGRCRGPTHRGTEHRCCNSPRGGIFFHQSYYATSPGCQNLPDQRLLSTRLCRVFLEQPRCGMRQCFDRM